MKTFGLSVLFLLLLAPIVEAQDCNCLKTPFEPKPKCFNECASGLLAGLNSADFQTIFGLKKESADRVADWSKRGKVTSLDEYIEVLSAAEIVDLATKIDSLSKQKLEILNKPHAEREKLIKDRKDLFGDSEGQAFPPGPDKEPDSKTLNLKPDKVDNTKGLPADPAKADDLQFKPRKP